MFARLPFTKILGKATDEAGPVRTTPKGRGDLVACPLWTKDGCVLETHFDLWVLGRCAVALAHYLTNAVFR